MDPTRICDGYPDCDGGEDETGCVCQPWEHFCGSQGAKGELWIHEISKFQDELYWLLQTETLGILVEVRVGKNGCFKMFSKS